MVTPNNQPTDPQGQYSAICLFEGWKIEICNIQMFRDWILSFSNAPSNDNQEIKQSLSEPQKRAAVN